MISKIIAIITFFALTFAPAIVLVRAQERPVDETVDSGTVTESAPAEQAAPEEVPEPFEAQVAAVNPLIVNISSPADNTSVKVGEDIAFSAAVTGGTAPYAYVWQFGDGTTGAGQATSKSYSTVGSYTVTLKVKDFGGDELNATASLTVANTLNENEDNDNGGNGGGSAQSALVVSISTPMTSSFATNESIAFSAAVTGGTAPYAYVWQFGDGTTGAGQATSKSYSTVGSYTVTLNVKDFDGNSNSATLPLTITSSNGGGDGGTVDLTVSNIIVTGVTHDSATITWETNRSASSRVIYDTTSRPSIDGQSGPNFGYAFSTETSDSETKVTSHSVTVTGLSPETSYYFRVISQE